MNLNIFAQLKAADSTRLGKPGRTSRHGAVATRRTCILWQRNAKIPSSILGGGNGFFFFQFSFVQLSAVHFIDIARFKGRVPEQCITFRASRMLRFGLHRVVEIDCS